MTVLCNIYSVISFATTLYICKIQTSRSVCSPWV